MQTGYLFVQATFLGLFCAAAVFVLAVCASCATLLSGNCAVFVPGPGSIIFANCITYCTNHYISLAMYPLVLRDNNGDHTVLFLEPDDVYLLLLFIFFVILALFILYRHLGFL